MSPRWRRSSPAVPFGNEIPANVPLIKQGGTTWTGVPTDIREGLTQFMDSD